MSDNKKYYYLKLKDSFFESDSMIVLESMPDGYKYSNILLKLYLRSLKGDGKLMFNERIPFNSNILSQVTRHSVGDVEKAIQIFRDLDLIEILDNGAIYMLDIQNFIGESSTEGDRKRLYRKKIETEKQLLLESGQTSGQMSDNRPPEIEIEIEKDIEKDIDIEIEIERGKKEEVSKQEVSKQTKKKSPYGEFKNVLLTDDEYKKLTERFSADYKERIERLSGYVASTGKSYKSHYATIINWAKKDSPAQSKKQADTSWQQQIGEL